MTDRVKAYRDRQKAAGLAQLSLWLDTATLHLLKQIAEKQNRPPGEIVAEAMQAWLADKPEWANDTVKKEESAPLAPLLPELIRQVVAELLPHLTPPPAEPEKQPPATSIDTPSDPSHTLPCPFLYHRPLPF
ncbi:MAG: hypothetical protein HQM06_07375 [Magnetococcales bacterium]|nr:hypothetical protein [Magnetococcales bacterium]